MIQKAEQAAQIANTPRLLPPAKAGLEALSEEAAATRAAAENARRMRQLEQDRQAATGAQQSVEAATKSANIAQKTAEEIADAQNVARLNQAKMTGAAQGLDIMQAVDSATSPSGLPTLKNIPADTSGFDTSAFENLTLPETKEEPEIEIPVFVPKEPEVDKFAYLKKPFVHFENLKPMVPEPVKEEDHIGEIKEIKIEKLPEEKLQIPKDNLVVIDEIGTTIPPISTKYDYGDNYSFREKDKK